MAAPELAGTWQWEKSVWCLEEVVRKSCLRSASPNVELRMCVGYVNLCILFCSSGSQI